MTAEACERQPEERRLVLARSARALVCRLFEQGLLADCSEHDAGVREEMISKAMSEVYGAGFDAGFRLQINARGRAGK